LSKARTKPAAAPVSSAEWAKSVSRNPRAVKCLPCLCPGVAEQLAQDVPALEASGSRPPYRVVHERLVDTVPEYAKRAQSNPNLVRALESHLRDGHDPHWARMKAL
jgi:hypothetical protein